MRPQVWLVAFSIRKMHSFRPMFFGLNKRSKLDCRCLRANPEINCVNLHIDCGRNENRDGLPWTKVCWHYPHRGVFAIRSMSNPSLSKLVSSAAGAQRMSTISDLRNHRPLVARSAMSSRFPSVVDTIARSIIAVMRLPGGVRRVSIQRSRRGRCG